MTTYSIREAKARLSEILRDLDRGDEVIITRRGRPCGRLTAVNGSSDDRPSLATLRGALSQLPDAGYQDFQDIKDIWATGERLPDVVSGDIDG
jgi:prevent-host-death family protein